jgi:L-alanine-DL-glutamate epimerase-like enolase superfamily enzyme
VKEQLVTDITISLVTPEQAEQAARSAFEDGFQTLKMKVGSADGPEADLERIAAVMRAAPGARLRLDANQAFSPDDAIDFSKKAVAICSKIELMEQPVSKEDFFGLRYVRERSPLPIFADESVQTPAQAKRLIELDAVDGINVKLMKSGILGLLDIATLCRLAGVKLMIGCMLESRLSLSAAVIIAAGTGCFDYIDLDAHRLLTPDGTWIGGMDASGEQLLPSTRLSGWGVRPAEQSNH